MDVQKILNLDKNNLQISRVNRSGDDDDDNDDDDDDDDDNDDDDDDD
ncbi:hypothetical protein ALC56_00293 [Trachymyrmex septentrionalis]|uniref:Uncharacterized protein n=1 Tax=Trachymyrmex septentrionalis TaxID=34720 RepID=A0A151K162_9HYME|nr:hypothetical protein ALC56_00293 [Trachymyrmex septentrionalis]